MAVSIVSLLIYLLLKRCTDFPQVELGFGLSYISFFVASVLGKDPLAPLLDQSLPVPDRVAKIAGSPLAQSTACLYISGIR
ncbi:hypothetical protein PG993_008486 [Apiospora rasikravindrae]|uniref:Uncharacterized protein n=1 Tax=Apiospora rasikravindrae TaxID=990691 RepID=A0ABR1T0H8_9PEZI